MARLILDNDSGYGEWDFDLDLDDARFACMGMLKIIGVVLLVALWLIPDPIGLAIKAWRFFERDG